MWIVIALVVILVLLAAAAVVLEMRRRRARPPVDVVAPPHVDPAIEEARHRAIDERGTELLDRRVDLDARRGTLAGDSDVNDAFSELENRFRSGAISEDEFEREKVRLLSG